MAVVLGFLLWGPDQIAKGAGMEKVLTEHRAFLGIAFFLFAAIALTTFWRVPGQKLLEWQSIYWSKRRLHDLTDEEKEILRKYVDEETRTQRLPSNGVVSGLCSEHIIYRSTSTGTGSWGVVMFGYNIQPWAWKYLRKRQHLLKNIERETDSQSSG